MMRQGDPDRNDPIGVYHLSDLRHGLLNWYPFAENARILELGCGFGALTGLLIEKGAHVDAVDRDAERVQAVQERFSDTEKLSVYTEDIRTYRPQETYDCIVIIDLLEEYEGEREELIRRCSSWLKDDGVLLLGFRNRNGVKYRCGALDEYVTEIFDTSRLLDMQEAVSITAPYFPCLYRYYIMPDVRFPQGVYTDAYMPKYTMRDRIIPVDYFDSPLIRNEADLYDELIRDHTLGEYSNYCLLEGRKQPPVKRVITASLSMDRSRDRAIPTIIYDDGTAEKRALYPEGKAVLERSYRNLEELKARGLSTVAQKPEDGRIIMPVITEKQLTDHIQELCLQNKTEEIYRVFEQMYANILQSSDTEGQDVYGSPVLVKAYTDMIPYNAFISEQGIRYYDQEFTREHCPAGYVMFRAVFYTYIHIPELAQLITRKQMCEHFGLTEDAWNAYMGMEMDFLEQVRNWTDTDKLRPDPERIAENRRHLQGTEAEYRFRDVHRVQLDLLKRFDRICQENGLRYIALHGTMLGAVRHHGFIPWDDDVDLGMPREDYEKLITLGVSDEHYFLQNPYNDRGCFNGGYACFRRTDTAAMREENMYHWCHEGIGIDIFPLDHCEPDKLEMMQKRVTDIQRLLYARVYAHGEPVLKDLTKGQRRRLTVLARTIPYRVLLKMLKMRLMSGKATGYRAVLACYYGKGKNYITYREEDLEHAVRMPFEDMTLPVPGNHEQYLKLRYGDTYMDIPKQRHPKHTEIYYDTRRSYRDCTWAKPENDR